MKKNYLLSLFILAICLAATVAAYKLFIAKPTYIYAKVKVGQGLWWASTPRPSAWFLDAIVNLKNEKPAVRYPLAQVLSVAYYPYYSSGTYDTYVYLRLKVSKIGPGKKYNFQRSTIGVGAPLDLQFDNAQFGGTIIKLSEKPIEEPYVEKMVTLTKKNVFPWEYDAIAVGDTFFNGETNALTITDKQSTDIVSMSPDAYGNYSAASTEAKKYITALVKMRGKMVNGQFVYAEDQVVMPGKGLSVASPNYVFVDFTVAKME